MKLDSQQDLSLLHFQNKYRNTLGQGYRKEISFGEPRPATSEAHNGSILGRDIINLAVNLRSDPSGRGRSGSESKRPVNYRKHSDYIINPVGDITSSDKKDQAQKLIAIY